MIGRVPLLHGSRRVVDRLLLVAIVSQGDGPADIGRELALRIRKEVM